MFTLTSLFISALLLIIFSFASVFIPTVVAETRCAYSPINQKIAVTNALEWSRLLELPDSAHNIEAETSGNIFTREIEVTFKASSEDIDKWISESPGTKNVIPIILSNGNSKYLVEKMEKVSFSELIIYKNENKVYLITYWS